MVAMVVVVVVVRSSNVPPGVQLSCGSLVFWRRMGLRGPKEPGLQTEYLGSHFPSSLRVCDSHQQDNNDDR